jgi:hypothetical protein
MLDVPCACAYDMRASCIEAGSCFGIEEAAGNGLRGFLRQTQ